MSELNIFQVLLYNRSQKFGFEYFFICLKILKNLKSKSLNFWFIQRN